MAKHIDFWFDFISHNAYLAWHGLKPIADDFGLEIRPQPIVFAGLLNHYGGQGPAENPAKSRWMLENVLRKARDMQLPISAPHTHPFNPLLLLRACLAVTDMEQRRQFSEQLFKEIWVNSSSAQATSTIEKACSGTPLSAQQLIEEAANPDIKDELHEQLRRAIKLGVFGVPSMTIDKQVFWGYDDLSTLRAHLAGTNYQPTEQELKAWARVAPSAHRLG